MDGPLSSKLGLPVPLCAPLAPRGPEAHAVWLNGGDLIYDVWRVVSFGSYADRLHRFLSGAIRASAKSVRTTPPWRFVRWPRPFGRVGGARNQFLPQAT